MIYPFRIAIRRLLKTPGFTLTVLSTLALCIGANLTIFAVVDALLIRALPYPKPERLVTVYYTYPRLASAQDGASLTTYYERRGQIPALASLAAISKATGVIGEPGSTTIEKVGRVTPEFFATLGMAPATGRFFREDEMTYQTDHVVVLSHEYWQLHYNGRTDALGQTVRLDGIPHVIVGILPKDFRFLSFQAPVYTPLSSEDSERNVGARHSLGTVQIGRIAEGASLADVQAQIDAHDHAHAAEFPQAKIVADAGCHSVVASLQADHVASVRPMLLTLQAGALSLLLIGMANLVNLLLIRASARYREFALRRALGASQGQVMREVVTETLVLTMGGAVFGLILAAFGIDFLRAFGADQLPLATQIQFNARVAVIAFLGAGFAGLLIAGPISWFYLRSRLAETLQAESRGSTASQATQRLRHGFIIAQIAVAFVLLCGAGLLGKSLFKAMQVAPGFRPDHVITGQFNLTWNGYHDLPAFHKFMDSLYEKTKTLPGLIKAGAISELPVTGATNRDVVTIPGYIIAPGQELATHNFFGVAGDYFSAIGIPLHAGRYLTDEDSAGSEFICVVDEEFARRYWPSGDALGKYLYRGPKVGTGDEPYRVVGLVGNVKQSGLTEKSTSGSVYFPWAQIQIRNYYLVARTSLPPDSLGLMLSKVVREIDPDVPLTAIRTMDFRIAESLQTRRSPALVVGVFAVLSLLLASLGLYGTIAYSVAQRTVEFGIRLALGAQRTDLEKLVLGQAGRLIAVGLILGVLVALAATRGMASLLFGVSTHDPMTYVGVSVLFLVVTVTASLIPVRRATRVDPRHALHAQ